MAIIHRNRGIILMICLSLALAGCALYRKANARDTDELLLAAGFVPKVPTTPEENAIFDKLKPMKIIPITKGNVTKFIYPDPYECHCIYVGTAEQFVTFKRLSVEEEIAIDNLMAAEMNMDYAGRHWWW
jgi:hypothetical protein